MPDEPQEGEAHRAEALHLRSELDFWQLYSILIIFVISDLFAVIQAEKYLDEPCERPAQRTEKIFLRVLRENLCQQWEL